MLATCPTNPDHKQFITVIHISEDVVVDENGYFLEVAPYPDRQQTHGPNIDNDWQCVECGALATVEIHP